MLKPAVFSMMCMCAATPCAALSSCFAPNGIRTLGASNDEVLREWINYSICLIGEQSAIISELDKARITSEIRIIALESRVEKLEADIADLRQ